MIFLFTDFGPRGPYLGQMRAVLQRHAPEIPVIDLLNDAPAFDPQLSAYLLAALLDGLAAGDVLLAVVDPGVGTSRAPLAVEADGHWLVGPDNGLFEIALRRARAHAVHEITWRPPSLSASFHGRDLFAPITARLGRGDRSGLAPATAAREAGWPDDLARIVHVDGYGNAMTGLRARAVPPQARLEAASVILGHAGTFGEVPQGQLFWYANSLGLVEIAANRARAADLLELAPGDEVRVLCAPTVA
jgi:S-adenosyl-L-methionine hydrolase (adenosine-forming)